jgi:hypothetical protein
MSIDKFFNAFVLSGLVAVLTLSNSFAQDRERDRDQYNDRDKVNRIDPGTTIPVRINDSIDVDKGDNRVYTGTVDADVRGENGRIVVPRGANVELMVRYSADNDLNLDLESIAVNGQRYAVRTDEKHIEAQRDNSLVGSIVGAINGGEGRGRAVRIPRDSVVTFRLARPLDVGIIDRGETRDGLHYHEWYGDRHWRSPLRSSF